VAAVAVLAAFSVVVTEAGAKAWFKIAAEVCFGVADEVADKVADEVADTAAVRLG
jgi:hypothetical protein